MNTKNLFCFPFAGGGTLSYRGLEATIGSVSVSTFELPGRGRRFGEPLLVNIELMVEDLFCQIQSQLQAPYAFYGHSMGGLLAYLLARRLTDKALPPPQMLFVSGCKGPVAISLERRHLLAQREFRAMLKKLGGCPDEILADAELMDLYEPVLRADFAAIASYRYEETPPFDLPIIVMIGIDDNVSEEEALRWQRETTRPIQVVTFHGEHFFIVRHWPEIGQLLAECMTGHPQRT